MNVFLRLKDDSGWSTTIRVDLTYQGYGKGSWRVFQQGDPYGLLCQRPGGWFDYNPNTECMDFQCEDQYGSWVTNFFICDAPSCSMDTSHTDGDGLVQRPANPAGNNLNIEWYRLDQMF